MAETVPSIGWGLDYDAAQFIALPTTEELAERPQLVQEWIEAAIAHYDGGEQLTNGDRQALTITAEAVLSMAEQYVTRLWFAPPGLYSDVLVSVVVTDASGDTAREIVADVTSTPGATAPDAVVIETDSHGAGILVRRTEGVQPEDGRSMLVARWDLVLHKDDVLIAVNAMGTTLPAFALLDGELMGLVDGIRL